MLSGLYVDRRLADCIAAAGSRGFPDHFARLLVEPAEMERLISSFTVNETYFYREDYQLRCLTSSLLGHITARKRPGQPIRIWSIPCSTGEEPYSIAIWLLENWPQVDAWDIEIIGLRYRQPGTEGSRGRDIFGALADAPAAPARIQILHGDRPMALPDRR